MRPVNIIVKGTHVFMTFNGEPPGGDCESRLYELASAAEAHPGVFLGTSSKYTRPGGELCIDYIGDIRQCAFPHSRFVCWINVLSTLSKKIKSRHRHDLTIGEQEGPLKERESLDHEDILVLLRIGKEFFIRNRTSTLTSIVFQKMETRSRSH